MDIVILAIVIGLVAWFSFYLWDKHKENNYQKLDNKKTTKFNNFVNSIVEQKHEQGKAINYSIYIMSFKERLFALLLAGSILFTIGLIFYDSYLIAGLMVPLALFYPKFKAKGLMEKRKKELTVQFKQALYALSSTLSVGKSVENAFREIVADLKMLYPNPSTYIIQEIELINRKIENGETIETALKDFSERANIDDITNFTDVFVISKRTGGDLNETIRKTSNIIGDKIEIQQEIGVLLAQKKFESRILNISPFVIVALLSYSSPDYMEPLYQLEQGGPIIMTFSLILLVIAVIISEFIMRIKV